MEEYKRGKTVKKKASPTMELTSSGADILDLALGGGVPWGKIINIVGDKSTGKTLIVCELIYRAIQKYKETLTWKYDDSEAGFSFDTKAIWGFELPDEDNNSETVEDFISNVRKSLDGHLGTNNKFIYVLDSLDGLSSEAEIKRAADREAARDSGKEEKGSYKMEKAKLLSEFFRLLKSDIKDSNCLLIIISQIRDKIGVTFGKKTTRTGGRALDFYASQVIELAEVEKLDETVEGNSRKTGVSIRANVTKNKVGKPFRQADFKILFDLGIDNVDSNLCFLFDLTTPAGRTSKKIKVDWDGEEFTSRKKLIAYIEENDQEEELKKLCVDKWDRIELAVSPKDRKKKI